MKGLTFIASIEDLLFFYKREDIIKILKKQDPRGLGSLKLVILDDSLWCYDRLSSDELAELNDKVWKIKKILKNKKSKNEKMNKETILILNEIEKLEKKLESVVKKSKNILNLKRGDFETILIHFITSWDNHKEIFEILYYDTDVNFQEYNEDGNTISGQIRIDNYRELKYFLAKLESLNENEENNFVYDFLYKNGISDIFIHVWE